MLRIFPASLSSNPLLFHNIKKSVKNTEPQAEKSLKNKPSMLHKLVIRENTLSSRKGFQTQCRENKFRENLIKYSVFRSFKLCDFDKPVMFLIDLGQNVPIFNSGSHIMVW